MSDNEREQRVMKLVAREGVLSRILETYDFEEGTTPAGEERTKMVIEDLLDEIALELESLGVFPMFDEIPPDAKDGWEEGNQFGFTVDVDNDDE